MSEQYIKMKTIAVMVKKEICNNQFIISKMPIL